MRFVYALLLILFCFSCKENTTHKFDRKIDEVVKIEDGKRKIECHYSYSDTTLFIFENGKELDSTKIYMAENVFFTNNKLMVLNNSEVTTSNAFILKNLLFVSYYGANFRQMIFIYNLKTKSEVLPSNALNYVDSWGEFLLLNCDQKRIISISPESQLYLGVSYFSFNENQYKFENNKFYSFRINNELSSKENYEKILVENIQHE